MATFRKIIGLFLLSGGIAAAGYFMAAFFDHSGDSGKEEVYKNEETRAPSGQEEQKGRVSINSKDENRREEILTEKNNEDIPESFLVNVPFTSQAPFGVWDEVHEETCEEASLVMVRYYLDKKPLTGEVSEREFQALVSFQNKRYGDFRDTNVSETVKIAEEYYGMENLEVIYDIAKEDLKTLIYTRGPIIVPAAGRNLGNPYYTPPGPLYHNLVAVGFDGDQIITNDPGTRRGEGYRYDIDVFYNAIHDFPGKKENIEQGRKAVIAPKSKP